jgi:hypothetical protein
MLNLELLDKLRYWIAERESIRIRKDAALPRPWTRDPILQSYKFCNVHREDDRVTRWFAQNWRNEKYWGESTFVSAIIFGRTINWPATLEAIGFPHIWNKDEVCDVMDRLQAMGKKVYTGAYMITAGPTGVRKNKWVTDNADSYFQKPPLIDPKSIRVSWERIVGNEYPCVGPFIAGQVIADLKQTPLLAKAEDWWDWAALGPGSARGLNRLHGRDLKFLIPQPRGLTEMREVKSVLKLELCLQDVQNCLCEFDKYMRVKLGQGKPRSGYHGA